MGKKTKLHFSVFLACLIIIGIYNCIYSNKYSYSKDLINKETKSDLNKKQNPKSDSLNKSININKEIKKRILTKKDTKLIAGKNFESNFPDKTTQIKINNLKYIIMDPVNKKMLDSNGKDVVIQGFWTRYPESTNNDRFGIGICKGKEFNTEQCWFDTFWKDEFDYLKKYYNMYKNSKKENEYYLQINNLLSDIKKNGGSGWGGGSYDSFWELPINSTYIFGLYINNEGGNNTSEINSNGIPLYIKAPKVIVKTDAKSLNTMLTNQIITGSGEANDTVKIVSKDTTWIGTVDKNGTFSIPTKGLKLWDSITITETNGTGEHSISDPLTVEFKVDKESINLTKPLYVIFDPQKETFSDETGEENIIIEGTWSSTTAGVNIFNTQIGGRKDPINDYNWFAGRSNQVQYNNDLILNSINYNLTKVLKIGLDTINKLPITKYYGILWGLNRTYGWDIDGGTTIIPFYIKAPKVVVKTDEKSLNTMLTNQIITGSGEANDTVKIVSKDTTWTGTVDKNGIFSIPTKGLRFMDSVTITETNGTGDKSISDSVIINFDILGKGNVPKGAKINPSIIGKSAGLLFTPENFSFGSFENFVPGETINKKIKANQYVGIGDLRKNKSGWKLTAKSSNISNNNNNNNLLGTININTDIKHISFKDGSYVIDNEIPKELLKDAPILSNKDGNVKLNIGKESVPIISATKDTGGGLWAVSMSDITLKSKNTNNLWLGTYTGEIDWNLSLTP